MERKLLKDRGFTLIELLVVVAIIGILAAVGVTTFSGFQKKAKIKATLYQHSVAVKYIQTALLSCELGGKNGFPFNGSFINYQCDRSLALETPLLQYLILKAGFKNPYRTNVYGAWGGTMLPKGWGDGLEVKYRPMLFNNTGKRSTGSICCHTLGHVSIQRVPFANAKLEEMNCEGTCCFVISTAYDVDSNGIGLVKTDTVSGNSCTR